MISSYKTKIILLMNEKNLPRKFQENEKVFMAKYK